MLVGTDFDVAVRDRTRVTFFSSSWRVPGCRGQVNLIDARLVLGLGQSGRSPPFFLIIPWTEALVRLVRAYIILSRDFRFVSLIIIGRQAPIIVRTADRNIPRQPIIDTILRECLIITTCAYGVRRQYCDVWQKRKSGHGHCL